jgi:hypothetical protein
MKKPQLVSGLIMLTMLATVCVANTRDWKNARVINVSETGVSWVVSGQTNTMHYTLETDDMVYFVDYKYKPGEKKNGKPPDIGINVVTKIAVEGSRVYVLDPNGKEMKLHVVKKNKK